MMNAATSKRAPALHRRPAQRPIGGMIANVHNLQYFLALCEEKNFTRTAKCCGVAQPSLTNAIRKLEHLLGGALFHRTRTSASTTVPTDLAIAVQPHFEQALSALEAALRVARDQHDQSG